MTEATADKEISSPFSRGGDRSAFLALAVLALFWGYNWVVMKIALRYASPFDFAALRALAGTSALMITIKLLGRSLRPHHLKLTALLGLLQTFGFVGLVNLALSTGQAGKSAILVYTMPFWVILLAPRFLGERIRFFQWVAVGLALAGLLFMLEPWSVPADLMSSVLALLAGLSWGAAVIVTKKIPIANRWELLSLAAWQMALGALPLMLMALLFSAAPVHWTWTFVGALAFNTIPANALAWLLWLYILQKLPANISGLSALAVPVVGVASAWLQLGERPGPLEAVGVLFILLALGLITVYRKR